MEDSDLNVLLIEDDEDDYILIREMLSDIQGKVYHVEWLSTFNEAEQRLKNDGWDVGLVDYDLGARNGLELIQEAMNMGVKSPMIMVTGRGRYELDVEAMKNGAADYLSKDMLNSAILERVIRYAVEHSRSREILEHLVQERTFELQNALDELRVTEEELRVQNDELQQKDLMIAEESALHRRTLGNFPLIEIITDREGLILETNLQAARLFRSTQASLRGKLLSLLIQHEDRKRFAFLLAQMKQISSPRTEQYRLWNELEGLPGWCLTVVPLKKQGALSVEYYWLIHPVYPET